MEAKDMKLGVERPTGGPGHGWDQKPGTWLYEQNAKKSGLGNITIRGNEERRGAEV